MFFVIVVFTLCAAVMAAEAETEAARGDSLVEQQQEGQKRYMRPGGPPTARPSCGGV